MEFTILQPPGDLNEAGGGAYVTALVAGLQRAGHRCVVERGTTWPAGTIPVIDGIGLTRFTAESVGDAVGLIHHPAALATDATRDSVRDAERRLLPKLRRVITTSQTIADRLVKEYGVDSGRITALPPGVADVPRSTGSGGATCEILSIGALVPRKGHTVLMTALARLFDLDWRLTIVGSTTRDPEHAAALRAQAETECPGRVHFAGTLDPASLELAWQRCDLFALATEWEGYAAPVAEALRRGVPVAVTSGGAAAELVTPENGVACPPGDIVGLSKALRRLIFDTDLRTDMAAAAWHAGQALPGWPAQIERFVEAVA